MSKPIAVVILIVSMLFWNSEPMERASYSDEIKSGMCQMTVEEFDLMSRVVEAESDRSDNLEGRVLIAEVILNRVESADFANDITGVCYQSGQFEVVSNGMIYSVGRTELSDAAVCEAYKRTQDGEAPNVMYFNNSNYAYGTPYCYEGGNYFVTVP